MVFSPGHRLKYEDAPRRMFEPSRPGLLRLASRSGHRGAPLWFHLYRSADAGKSWAARRAACDNALELVRRTKVDRTPIYVRDENCCTSAGVTAGIDLALAFVEEDLGRQIALRVAQMMVVFLRRPAGSPVSARDAQNAQETLQGSSARSGATTIGINFTQSRRGR